MAAPLGNPPSIAGPSGNPQAVVAPSGNNPNVAPPPVDYSGLVTAMQYPNGDVPGTHHQPFRITREQGVYNGPIFLPFLSSGYHNITMQREYQEKSPEELRLEDYILEGKFKPRQEKSKDRNVISDPSGDEGAQKLRELDEIGQVFHVKVEKDKASKTFAVPRSVLRRSDFFAAMLKGNWKEQDAAHLQETDPTVFSLYLRGIYANNFAMDAYYTGVEEYLALAQIYILADKLQDYSARNAIMDIFSSSDHDDFHADHGVIKTVFTNLTRGRPLRRFLLDGELFRPRLRHPDADDIEDSIIGLPIEYVTELLGRSTLASAFRMDPNGGKSRYHEHGGKSPAGECVECVGHPVPSFR